MESVQPVREAGLVMDCDISGTRLVVRDATPGGCAIRNRGGEALATFLAANRQIKSLDIREAGMSDNAVAHICRVLRQTDQLEELALSPVGLAGLEFIIGVLRQCTRLAKLSASVIDAPTLVAPAQNLVPDDYNTSVYEGRKREDGDEEPDDGAPADDDDEQTPEERERKKLEKLRQLFAENDYDSGDEGATVTTPASKETSPGLQQLLDEFIAVVRKRESLLFIELTGDAVPVDVRVDLARIVEEHQHQRQRRVQLREERGSRTAHDALKDQMEELRLVIEAAHGGAGGDAGVSPGVPLPGETVTDGLSRLGMRAYIGRRLFSALGEALFECQRYKSKGNEALATWEGECAFLAMYLRKMAKDV